MGRDRRNELRPRGKIAVLHLSMMETAAWLALSCYAKALYPLLLMEWKGPNANNNGKIQLSVRQAAEKLGIGINTAARAFHELQAHGFIVVKQSAALGVKGFATAPEYEITEMAMPGHHEGRKLFKDWKAGCDYPVQKAAVHNLRGTTKKQNPVIRLVTSRHQRSDV